MAKPMDDKEVRKYLEAFADGELDVEQNLRVLEHMAMNPQATRRAMHQQQLRQAVERAMKESAPATPPALRAKIEAIAKQADADDAETLKQMQRAKKDRGVLAVLRRWTPAIAAGVLLAITASLIFLGPKNPTAAQVPINLVDASVAAKLDKRHEICSEAIERLYKAELFGADVAELPDKVKAFLNEDAGVPVLDLSSIDYEYAGAGQCGAPGGKAVHLVYRPRKGSQHTKPISLWIREDSEHEVPVEAGKVYAGTPIDAPHPILVWRRDNVVFYLTGLPLSELLEPAEALAKN